MDLKEKLLSLLNKAYSEGKLYYIGLFIKGKVYVSKSTGNLEKLEENFSKMIERSLIINEAIKNFNAEFLFAENKEKNFSIFIDYITNDIAIGIIHIEKPNFSLLKIIASDLAQEIKPLQKQLSEIYETQLKEKNTKEDTTFIDKTKEEEKQTFEIEELEKVLSQNVKSDNIIEEIKVPDLFEILEEKPKEEKSNQEKVDLDNVPTLEEILKEKEDVFTEKEVETQQNISKEEYDTDYVDKVFNEINTIFIKYIGPFGKFMFNKKKEEYFKTNSYNKFSILKFCHVLSEEIPEGKKREAFLEEIKGKLLNI